jgi:cyclopropane fatty-acyl-phospholipid synthase-like methyltransferase
MGGFRGLLSDMPSIQQEDWYKTPLYYDIIFDEDTQTEADFLEAVCRKYAGYEKGALRILEPACGSGRLVGAMCDRWHEVVGFDLSEQMIEFAKARHTQAKMFVGKMQDFKASGKKFDMAHCLVSTFKYLLSEGHALAHLQLVADHLKKGGIYVLGLHLSDYDRTKVQHERWSGEREGVSVVCNTRTWPPDRKKRLESLRTRLRVTENGVTKLQETRWQFRTYDARQLRALLGKVPAFEVVGCYDFWCDVEAPRELDDEWEDLVVVLRKK